MKYFIYFFVFIILFSGCSAKYSKSEYAIVEISQTTPNGIIYKIDDMPIGKKTTRVRPGYREIEFCKKYGALCHSNVKKSYVLKPNKRYTFELKGNILALKGVVITKTETPARNKKIESEKQEDKNKKDSKKE